MSNTLKSLRFTTARAYILLTILFIGLSFSCNQKKTDSLVIATAANMQFAMIELTKTFSKKTGIACQTILGSSGKLTAQIIAGAPYDLFVSADMKYPEELYERGLTEAAPKVYTSGRLVLWTMEKKALSLPESLTDDHLSHIAMANPKTAPYGAAAMETLEALGLAEPLETKLVYGESISQTNQFINSQAAQIGFTSKSVVIAPNLKGKGTWIDIPPHYHSPLKQAVVILKGSTDHREKAIKFYEFLFSEEAKEILNKFGYSSIP